jgi:hypothetical protein
VNYTHLIPNTVLVSNVSAVTFGDATTSSVVRIRYFPSYSGASANLSMFVKNETSGSFDSMPFTLDAGNKIVYSTVTVSGEYCVMDKNLWNARFDAAAGQMAMKTMAAPLTVSYYATGTGSTKTTSSIKGSNASLSVAKTPKKSISSLPAFVNIPVSGKQSSNLTLVNGVHYGFNISNGTPRTILDTGSFSRKNSTNSKSAGVNLSLKSTAMVSAVTDSGTLYEAVSNGNFSKNYAGWSPSSSQEISRAGYTGKIIISSAQYTSPSKSMYIDVGRLGGVETPTHFETVLVHSNVDISHASQLTFNYKCVDKDWDYKTDGIRLNFGYIDTNGNQHSRAEWEYPWPGKAVVTPDWVPVTVDLSSVDRSYLNNDMMTFFIKAYIDANNGPGTRNAYAKYLIDDVSVLSTEEPRGPTDAVVQFHVYKASTGDPVSGTVYVYKTPSVSTPYLLGADGLTQTVVLAAPGTYQFDVDTYEFGLQSYSITVSQGQTGIQNVPLGTISSNKGSLNLYSTPPGADIYLDGSFRGQTPITINDISAGDHTLEATKTDYQLLSQTVTVISDSTSTLDLTLVPLNSDPDDIPDYVEKAGVKSPFGSIVTSDPDNVDTDGDGLTDDEEIGGVVTSKDGFTFNKVTSDPRKADSDEDGLFDPDELDIGTKPQIQDTDEDGLSDYQEIERGTDPLDKNTDGDSADDFTELMMYSWGAGVDPNVAITYQDKTPQQELETMICGATLGAGGNIVSTCDTESQSYVAGWMLSPSGKVTALRDFSFFGYQGDIVGAFLNAIQFKTVQKGMGKLVVPIKNFVVRNPQLTGDVGKIVAKYSDDILQTGAILKNSIHGENAYNRIVQKLGNGDETIVIRLYERGVNVKLLDDALTSAQIYDRYPGLGNFIARTLLNEEGMASRVTIDLTKLESTQKAGKTSSIQRWLGNIQGAYGEYKGKEAIYREGMTIIKDLSHVNKPGLDLVLRDGNTIKIIECKAVKDLSVSNLRNYLITDKTTGAISGYNANYAVMEGLQESYFTDPTITKQFILYINSPESTAIKSKLDLPASVPYKYTKGGIDYTGTVQIIVMAE